jgi:putative component of toxin-antitoxin plasmid stabilization module
MVAPPTHQVLHQFHHMVSFESAEIHIEQAQSKTVGQKYRKKVQFYHSVYVQETLHLNNYSEDERHATWNTRKEATRMRAEMNDTLDLLKSGEYNGDSEQHCSRGLEYRIGKGRAMRHYNKMNGLLAVLEEQENQKYEQRRDHQAIAIAYALATKHCVIEASKLGQEDAVDTSGYISPEVCNVNEVEYRPSKRGMSFTLNLFKRIKR